MTIPNIARWRLINQQLINSRFTEINDLARWMVCIQAQDFAGAKWAIGNRINGITEADIDKQFNEGKILRTHILRPTWHFVSPDDIRWILKLTAPRIMNFSKYYHTKMELNKQIFTKCKNIIAKALTGGKRLNRNQLIDLLKKAKINTDDIRSTFIMMEAELDGLICSGGRQGKQFTYALLDEVVPNRNYMDNDAALVELAKRYFNSHCPATLQDFVWWSGLTTAQAKIGLELNKKNLDSETLDNKTYWFAADLQQPVKHINSILLLPAFDEYTVGYKDRSHAGNKLSSAIVLNYVIVQNGQVIGTWKRVEGKGKVEVQIYPFSKFNSKVDKSIKAIAKKYAGFLGKELVVN